MVFVYAHVKLVVTAPRDELDLNRSLATAFSTRSCSRHGHFFNGIQAGTDSTEKTISGFQIVVLNVYAIKSDVDRSLWQAVNRRIAVNAGSINSRKHHDEVQRVPGNQRKIRNLIDGERGRNVCR